MFVLPIPVKTVTVSPVRVFAVVVQGMGKGLLSPLMLVRIQPAVPGQPGLHFYLRESGLLPLPYRHGALDLTARP